MSSRVICIAHDQILSFTHQVTTLGYREGQCLKKHSCESLLLPSGTDTQEGGCWIGWELHFSVFEGTFFPRMAGPVCVPSFPTPWHMLFIFWLCWCSNILRCVPMSEPAECCSRGCTGTNGGIHSPPARTKGASFHGSQAVIARVWIWSLSLRKRWIRGGQYGEI